MTSDCSSECRESPQCCLLGRVFGQPLLVALLSLLLIVPLCPAAAASSLLHPWLDFPAGWQATVEVVNLGPTAATVRLLAYDGAGTFLGEIPGGMTLAPGERGR